LIIYNNLGPEDEYFFVFSGDGGTLAHSELYALLETYGNDFSAVFGNNRFLTLRATKLENIKEVLDRGSYVLAGCKNLGSAKLDNLQKLQSVDLSSIVENIQTFRIDCYDLANIISSVLVERKISAIIKQNHPRLRVSMKSPDATFVAAIRDGIAHLGYSLAEKVKQHWERRRPKTRPFFYAAALFPKFARCLVNLTKARGGETFLDPFCGSGTIVTEATLMGVDAVGIDIFDELCRGSLLNLKALGLPTYTVVQADARNLPLHSVSGIATDIPYGKTSAFTGNSSREMLEDFFKSAVDILEPGKRMVLVYPEPMKFSVEGFSMIANHKIRVHRSLTRVIAEYQHSS